MAISQRRMTLEEFLLLAEEEPALEYEQGAVKQKVMPKPPHGKLQARLTRLFDNFAEPIQLASSFTETRVTFDGDSLVPDLVVYRWERIQRNADGEVADEFTTPPDIAVEIVSPGQSVADLEARCRWYVEHGVQLVLLVNPRNRRNRWVKLFRAGQESDLLTGDAPIDFESVLPGFRLTVQELFDALWLRQ